MFEKVAKGFGGVVFGGESDNVPEDAAVENLLQRVADGVLAEDRREALEQLRDRLLDSTAAKSALGAMGFPIICEVIREERKDLDMLRAALECLANAFTTTMSSADAQVAHVISVNAELFSREKEHVPLLLSLLEEEPVGVNDFHLQYHALQILTALSASPHRLQEAVLAYPMGVVRLMDMLAEREVVRNEALLLLIVLVHGNADIQKIVAFENAFERLLAIIREEGAADGGIVVQDCLQLIHGLLRKNPSNQRMFRELGMIAVLPSLLRLKQRGGVVPRQSAANLLYTLETMQLLIAAGNAAVSREALAQDAESAANQEALVKSGILNILIGAPLGDHAITSIAVRSQALQCLASMCLVNKAARDQLGAESTVVQGAKTPALQALLHKVVHAKAQQERQAAKAVVQAFCTGNAAGPATLLKGDLGPMLGGPFAPLVQQAAGGQFAAIGRAARLLSLLLLDGSWKQRALDAKYQQAGSAEPQQLLPRCLDQLAAAAAAAGTDSEAALAVPGLLGLLIAWCHDYPAAVALLAQAPARLNTVAALASDRSSTGNTAATGLAAVVLGQAVLVQQDTRQQGLQAAADAVQAAVAAHGSPDQLLSRIRQLLQCPAFEAAAAGPKPLQPFTRAVLAAALASDEGVTRDSRSHCSRQNVSAASSSDAEQEIGAHLVPLIRQTADLLPQKLLALNAQQPPSKAAPPNQQPSVQYSNTAANRPSSSDAQPDELSQAHATINQLRREMDQLRLYGSAATAAKPSVTPEEVAALWQQAAAAQQEVQTLRQRLNQATAEMDSLRAALEAANGEAESAKAAATKAEADLEDMAGAFQGLESHAFQLEAELRDARAQPPAAPSAAPSPEEVQRQIDKAVEEANAEAEENLNDLLACLGQEERKTDRLSERLQELGVDVDAILEALEAEAAKEDADDEDLT